MDSINIYFYNANFFTVSGQTLEVEMNELSQGLKVIQRDILEISSREKMDDDHFEETMKVSPILQINFSSRFSLQLVCPSQAV